MALCSLHSISNKISAYWLFGRKIQGWDIQGWVQHSRLLGRKHFSSYQYNKMSFLYNWSKQHLDVSPSRATSDSILGVKDKKIHSIYSLVRSVPQFLPVLTSQSLYFPCDMYRTVGPGRVSRRGRSIQSQVEMEQCLGPQAVLEYKKRPLECSALLAAAVIEDAARKSSGYFLQDTALVHYQCPRSLD